MFIAGQREMQLMDQYTMEKIGLPGVVLMENAGAKVVEEIISSAPCSNPRIVVLAGGGNNGGDGFVIARRLYDQGLEPILCLLVHPDRIQGDAKIHYEVLVNRNLPIFHFQEQSIDEFQWVLSQADIIVDALLGTGVKGPLREPFAQVIQMVNQYVDEKMIIAVDIPSGVASDDGKVEGVAVQATKTVTFVFPKRGFFLNDGPNYIGEWKAVDISVPPSIVNDLNLNMPRLITESLVYAAIPKRPPFGHKGTFGHVLVLGGSRSYVGAPTFTSKAAFNSGAGLVTLAIPESIYPVVASQNLESLLLPLPDEDGHFSKDAITEIRPKLKQFQTIAIGPGLSRFPGGDKFVRSILLALDQQTIVIDADALYLMRNQLDLLSRYKGNVILTPHPGEMATLLGTTVKEVEENRIEVATNFARTYQVYLLLKGHRSICATPNGDVYINPCGNDALGKGGSGDVLTGMIASFLAQGASPTDALIAATYLHAKTGEDKGKALSNYGVTPSDLIEGLKEQLR